MLSQVKRLAATFRNPNGAHTGHKMIETGFKVTDPLFPRVRYMGPALCGITLTLGIFIVGASLNKRNNKTMIIQPITKWRDVEPMLQIVHNREKNLEKQRVTLRKKFKRWLSRTKLPESLKQKIGYFGERMINTTEAERTIAGLIAINTVVFSMWQIPRLTPWMYKWFTHLPGSQRNITLLTSCFSHRNIFDFGLNMFTLAFLGQLMHFVLGREQFVAMYLGTGICTNVISHIGSLASRQSVALIPRYGADGATFGLLAYSSTLFSDLEVGTSLPFRSITIMRFLIGLDLYAGCTKGGIIGYDAHFAGKYLGLAYMYYGYPYIWKPLCEYKFL